MWWELPLETEDGDTRCREVLGGQGQARSSWAECSGQAGVSGTWRPPCGHRSGLGRQLGAALSSSRTLGAPAGTWDGKSRRM